VRVTHFGHACVLVETDRARILFDPGMFSSDFDELADVSAVLVTPSSSRSWCTSTSSVASRTWIEPWAGKLLILQK
jgi:hypothetical protein